MKFNLQNQLKNIVNLLITIFKKIPISTCPFYFVFASFSEGKWLLIPKRCQIMGKLDISVRCMAPALEQITKYILILSLANCLLIFFFDLQFHNLLLGTIILTMTNVHSVIYCTFGPECCQVICFTFNLVPESMWERLRGHKHQFFGDLILAFHIGPEIQKSWIWMKALCYLFPC